MWTKTSDRSLESSKVAKNHMIYHFSSQRGAVYPETMAFGSIFLFITLFWFLFNNPRYSETDTLHQGQELKDWDELISSNKVFCLKFFSFGTMVHPYLGVFYNKEQTRYHNSDQSRYRYSDYSDDFSDMAVWVANRNNPVPDINRKLIIDVNGKFSILSGGGTVLDLFNRTPLVKRNASVTLLDSGNLVLQELHPNGSFKHILWQSFDYPTDALLPGMKLGINLKTGQKWSLISWRNDELPAKGLFTLDLNETGQMVILRQGKIHWASGPWEDGEFKNTYLHGCGPDVRLDYVSNETEISFTYLTRTYDSYPALRMHQDGRLKGSSLNLSLHCRFINDPPGCAEDEFENLSQNHQLSSLRGMRPKLRLIYTVDVLFFEDRLVEIDCNFNRQRRCLYDDFEFQFSPRNRKIEVIS